MMAIIFTHVLTRDEANDLIALAQESQFFVRSKDSDLADYPPTVVLNEMLQTLVKSIELHSFSGVSGESFDSNLVANDISKYSFREDAKAICDLKAYRNLYELTQTYLKRSAKAAKEYKDTIVTRLAELLEDTESSNATTSQKIDGLLTQLRTRQTELNQEVKKTTDTINQLEQSVTTRTEREFSRLTNNVKKLESEVLQKLESLSSDTLIQLQEIANSQRLDLAEQTAKQIDDALETKRKSVFDHLEHDSNRLLSLVQKEVSSLSTRVNQEVNEFCLLNEALRKTLKFISSDALADASIAQATIEKESADKLRIFGVSWLLLSIFLFLTTFDYEALVDKDGVPQYTLILLRSFFLIVGSAPAFYLLRESARHRTDERRYRQKGIQLATIDGYLAEFEGADRNNVKKELTKHYFHGGDHFVDSSSIDSVQGIYEKILDRVLSSEKNKTTQESQKDTPA